MKAAADWSATILTALLIISIGGIVLGWIADHLIAAIDWMTRHE